MCLSKIFFFLQGKWDFQQNAKERGRTITIFLSQKSFQLCCATCLDRSLTQPWTDFWLYLFHMFAPFFLAHNMLKPIFYRVFSKIFFVAHPKQLRTLFVNTTALTEIFFVLFFLPFFFGGGGCCVLFLGVFLFERNAKHKTKHLNTKQPQRNKTTRCKPENHLVSFTKKESRQLTHTHKKRMQLHCLDYKQTTQEAKSKNKRITYKTNYLLTNLTSQNTNIAEKTMFFIDWKQNKKQDKQKNKYQKQNQHRNRKAEAYTMKTTTRTTEEKRTN